MDVKGEKVDDVSLNSLNFGWCALVPSLPEVPRIRADCPFPLLTHGYHDNRHCYVRDIMTIGTVMSGIS